MNSKQKRIVLILGGADLVVILLLVGAVLFSSLPAGQETAPVPTPSPTNTPTVTPIPTWTPTPTATPYVPPTPTIRPTSTPRPLRSGEAAVMDQVEGEVSALRGLVPRRAVQRRVITRTRLKELYADVFITEVWEEEAWSTAMVLSTFDFMEPDTDLLALWQDGVARGILGFYVSETEEIFVVNNAYSLGALERAVYAHEFDHALQDQYFDLQALGLEATSGSENGDRLLAVQALVEGDATLLQEQYVMTYFTEQDAWTLLHQLLSLPSASAGPAPRVLGALSDFPYTSGREFVGALYERGGWQAVNDAYAAPPASTEHILHPQRYLAGDQPVPVSLPSLEGTLGGGWRAIYDDTIGELMVRLYLENHLDGEMAAKAAEGWGGDRCVVYYNDATGGVVTALNVVWDTPADAREFLRAYTLYADARFGHAADTTAEGEAYWYGDEDVLGVTWGVGRVTLALGPDRETVEGVLAAVAP